MTSAGDGAGIVLGGIALLVLLPTCLVWIPLQASHPPGYHGGSPITATLDLLRGRTTWTTSCTIIAASETLFLTFLGMCAVMVWRLARNGRSRVDWAARRMATPHDLKRLTPQAVAQSAHRLRPAFRDTGDPDEYGIGIGTTVAGGVMLRQTWEDMACDIWGPRTGKTTARAIPAIVAAPGPVLATSVKADIVDATRDVRAQRGQVWIFDPMHILDRDHTNPTPPGFWWSPLRGITTITAARILADHFSFATQTGSGVVRDPFFDTKAADFTAALILAAAADGRDITQVYRWATSQRDTEPAQLLAQHGYRMPADSVYGVLAMPDRTRGSVYAIAEASLAILTEPSITAWITPPPVPRPEFDLASFVGSTDTLYLLSRAGPGTPAPLIAAFTDAVLRAGETAARSAPGRRLDPPLLSCLDEAANIVRIRQLPDLYSFYGSHGLPIITILQSWAQGEEVWGKAGIRKLWDSSNIRTYGGGVADPAFLDEISRAIGHYWSITRSVSTQSRSWDRTTSHTPQRLRLLDVEELFAMPVGRMVVLPSGAPPALVKTRPWQTGTYASQIRASLARWDPAGQYPPTLQPTPRPGLSHTDLSQANSGEAMP